MVERDSHITYKSLVSFTHPGHQVVSFLLKGFVPHLLQPSNVVVNSCFGFFFSELVRDSFSEGVFLGFTEVELAHLSLITLESFCFYRQVLRVLVALVVMEGVRINDLIRPIHRVLILLSVWVV